MCTGREGEGVGGWGFHRSRPLFVSVSVVKCVFFRIVRLIIDQSDRGNSQRPHFFFFVVLITLVFQPGEISWKVALDLILRFWATDAPHSGCWSRERPTQDARRLPRHDLFSGCRVGERREAARPRGREARGRVNFFSTRGGDT